jgi:hypothetical protein
MIYEIHDWIQRPEAMCGLYIYIYIHTYIYINIYMYVGCFTFYAEPKDTQHTACSTRILLGI